MTQENENDDLTSFQLVVSEYGQLFAASISFEGLICLLVVYIRLKFGKQKISKMTLRAYVYSMLFLLL